MALSKKRRLDKKLVKKVLKEGKAVRGRGISLKYSVVSGHLAAFAFVVSSKTAGKAVLRNKIKRRGRTVVFKLLPNIKEDRLVVVFFEKSATRMNFSEIEREITLLFQKADLLTQF